MKFYLIFILAFYFQSTFCQESDLFKLEVIEKEKSDFKKDYELFKHKFEDFYEDENYIVKDSCRGEFGGTIKFQNKNTSQIYVAKSTCSASLIKINGIYYLTTSLAHMSGSCGLYEISDPTELTELKPTDSFKEKFFKQKSDKGLKELYKKFGGTILVSFPYQNELYFISTYKKDTYLTKIENSEMIKVKKLLDYSVFTYDTEIKITEDNHYLNNFQVYGEGVGFFDVKDNIIKINLYK